MRANHCTMTFLMLFVVVLFLPNQVFAQLQQGIQSYRDGDYTRAVELLERAQQKEPDSSAAAFFLGMAHKQSGDFEEALVQLRRSVRLEPKIKEALVELIDVLYKLYSPKNAEEAFEWIEVAEEQGIYEGKVAFLKGLFLQKEERYEEAVESFERASSKNPRLKQSSEFQIARCYAKLQDLDQAKLRLEAAIQQDPTSDLAGFARRYVDLIEERIKAERPLRLTLGAYGQYDTNVVLKPIESSLAPDIQDEESLVLTSTARVDYVPRLEGDWLFNAYYAGTSVLHDKFSTSHDVLSNTLYAAPGYRLENGAVNLAIQYDHALVRDPSYKEYVGSLTVGPLYRRLLSSNQILELSAGYRRNSYYRPVLVQDEDRDGAGLVSYVSWVWLFMEDGFFNAKYSFSMDDTDGRNWDKKTQSLSLNVGIPVVTDLVFQLSGMATFDNYNNHHTVFGNKREDDMYQGSIGFDWNAYKDIHVIFQFSAISNDSNIGIYDYDREIYTVGIEYRY